MWGAEGDEGGNLANAAYRGSSYGFDGENRLGAVNLPSGTVTTSYDPAGRLRQAAAGAVTQFLYDGDQLIAEYNASGGALIGRYVPGAGANETALAYDSGGAKSWYHGDAQGSVVAASDASGNAVTINQYGPYGEPGTVYQGRNQGRIRYTGQTILFEAGTTTGINQILYDYRARIYAPKLGRFLQTDPIGAQDDRNLYAYVANDPVNITDPTGLFADSIASHPKTSIAVGAGIVAAGACAVIEPCGATVAAGAAAIGRGALGLIGRGGSTAAETEAVNLGSLTPGQATRIQSFADKYDITVNVVGSRAKGTAEPQSDFDYILGNDGATSRLRAKARLELPRGTAGGEIHPSRGETGIDVFKAPLDPSRPYIPFNPKAPK